MRIALTLAAMLLTASTLHADEKPAPEPDAPKIVETVAQDAPMSAKLNLEEIQIEESAATNEAPATQDLPERGSFWWVVGAVVVAGVILAVIL